MFLGTVRAGDLSDRGVNQNRFEADLPAQRGAIQARNGADLAIDRLAVDVTATPYLVTDPEGTAAKLGPVIERDPNEIANALSRPGGYVVLAQDVPPALADRAKELDLPGIDFSDTWQRFYPGGLQASQLVGLTGDAHEGISGMELQLDEALTGDAGPPGGGARPARQLDPGAGGPRGRGRARTCSSRSTRPSRTRVERTLAATREEYGARSATGIVMDPRTGAVLAMATVPRFNPNRRADRSTEEPGAQPAGHRHLRAGLHLQDRDHGGGARGPAGAARAPPSRCPRTITRYDRTLRDAHERPAVVLSACEILAQSSNIGTVSSPSGWAATRLQAWIERLRVRQPHRHRLPRRGGGAVLPLERWSGTSIINIPIGQGIGVTLAQLTRVYAAVANGGRLVEPHLVHRVGGTDVEHPGGRQIMTARTARTLDRMLRGVVSPDGTGSLAQIEGYQVAGKTGTANKIDPLTGEYSSALYTSSFVGYVPANDPQLVVSVVVDEPGGAYYGGEVAAPAFEDIAAFSLQTLNIAP